MDDRIKYRYWINEDWHNPNSKLEPVYCNIVDGCDPTTAISDFEFCTGLKDKNGNLIYEGDIVNTSSFGKCIIEWADDEAGFILKSIETVNYYSIYCFNGTEEIIGNIHENPELLEE